MKEVTVSIADRVYRTETFEASQRDVERAIELMNARSGELLTVDDLADVEFNPY